MLDLLFLLLFFTCAIFALGVVTRSEPVYSVLCLIMVFISASCMFLLLQVDFVAMALIMLYLGAIAVLFLFVVMMIGGAPGIVGSIYSPRYSVIALCVTGALGLLMGSALYDGSFHLPKVHIKYPVTSATSGAEAIGSIIFTHFRAEFIVLSFVLLVAILGAVVLTAQGINPEKKRQGVGGQLARKGSVLLKKVAYRKGVDW